MADHHGSSPLLVVASHGDLQSIKLLLATPHVDLNVACNDGWNALMSAAFKDQAECIRLLVDSGADVNATTNNGWTPLMIACSKSLYSLCQFSLDIIWHQGWCIPLPWHHSINGRLILRQCIKCIQSLLHAQELMWTKSAKMAGVR